MTYSPKHIELAFSECATNFVQNLQHEHVLTTFDHFDSSIYGFPRGKLTIITANATTDTTSLLLSMALGMSSVGMFLTRENQQSIVQTPRSRSGITSSRGQGSYVRSVSTNFTRCLELSIVMVTSDLQDRTRTRIKKNSRGNQSLGVLLELSVWIVMLCNSPYTTPRISSVHHGCR
jgi:hypothetical protein